MSTKIIFKLGAYATLFAALAASSAANAAILNGVVDVSVDSKTKASSSIEATVNVSSDVKANASSNESDKDTVKGSSTVDAYIATVVKDDKNVDKVSTTDSSVSVWYKQHGKFLGIIPVTVSTEAKVNADGSVVVNNSWYNFLTTIENKDSLESNMDVNVGTLARAQGEEKLSSEAKVKLIAAIRSVMKANYESNVSAQASY